MGDLFEARLHFAPDAERGRRGALQGREARLEGAEKREGAVVFGVRNARSVEDVVLAAPALEIVFEPAHARGGVGRADARRLGRGAEGVGRGGLDGLRP